MVEKRITTLDLPFLNHLATLLAGSSERGDIFCLIGDLGAGKTTFARYFIQALVGKSIEVPSPTFTLCQTYETPKGEVYHYDLYRLENSEDIAELGLRENLAQTITLIEWPEKILPLLPSRVIRLVFELSTELTRTLTLSLPDSMAPRFASFLGEK